MSPRLAVLLLLFLLPAVASAEPATKQECAAAAKAQGAKLAESSTSMRKSIIVAIMKTCQSERWSARQAECVGRSEEDDAIERCRAREQVATAEQCAAAAEHQAAVLSESSPSLRQSMTSAIESTCATEQWSAGRVECVLDASAAEGFEACMEGEAAAASPTVATSDSQPSPSPTPATSPTTLTTPAKAGSAKPTPPTSSTSATVAEGVATGPRPRGNRPGTARASVDVTYLGLLGLHGSGRALGVDGWFEKRVGDEAVGGALRVGAGAFTKLSTKGSGTTMGISPLMFAFRAYMAHGPYTKYDWYGFFFQFHGRLALMRRQHPHVASWNPTIWGGAGVGTLIARKVDVTGALNMTSDFEFAGTVSVGYTFWDPR